MARETAREAAMNRTCRVRCLGRALRHSPLQRRTLRGRFSFVPIA